MALRSAWEIALEKHEKYEELSEITHELLEHVALLEEGWDAIRPGDGEPRTSSRPYLERAA
jgi:hypothetical protein